MRRSELLAILLCVGCGSAPSISAEKVAEFSKTFEEYAVAVEAVRADVDAAVALPEPPSDETLAPISADLGTIAEALHADAANVKTGAVTERLEKVGTAIASLPHPFAKIAGYGLTLLSLGGVLLFTRKKPTLPSKEP